MAGQPTVGRISDIKAAGYRSFVSLALTGPPHGSVREAGLVAEQGALAKGGQMIGDELSCSPTA